MFGGFIVMIVDKIDSLVFTILVEVITKINNYNETLKIENEIKFPTIDSNIVEVNNLTFKSSFCNFYNNFILFEMSNNDNFSQEKTITNNCDMIERKKDQH